MRTAANQLRLFGGSPAFAEKLHVGRPNIGDRKVFDRLVDGMFERRWFTNNGQLVRELESRLCDYLGVRHCIAVCNATVGLQIACHALELKGEVIVPAFTFVATAHALQWERLRPVFADIDPLTHNIDPRKIPALINDDTSAIMGVHLWGRPCETEAIDAIAEHYGLDVLYDAAHAFGCRHRGRMIGSFGRCEVFSFHATKFFNTFEGGAIATNDDAFAKKVRLIKNFGFSGMDEVNHLGTNGKMPEICAAMGLASFETIDDILAVNRTNYETYRACLDRIPGVHLISYDQLEATNWQYIILEVDDGRAGLTRDELMTVLRAENVLARRYFYPGCHRMEPYRTLFPRTLNRLPVTDRLCQRVLCLPTGTSLSPLDIETVCEIIRAAVDAASKVRKELATA
ncbi:MAG: DegT/DnrJ/EryC1/StrS family aminotransferase [Deltaproteobacteria bacterium]|nr:DegT/DnrJ/EryC1/StrS family aminotransferase [Deltaproteobacteria bacterium]